MILLPDEMRTLSAGLWQLTGSKSEEMQTGWKQKDRFKGEG